MHVVRGPFAELVSMYAERKGYRIPLCIRIGATSVSILGNAVIEDKVCHDSISDVERGYDPREILGPSPLAKIIRKALRIVKRGVFDVYTDPVKHVKLYFVPIPRAPWFSLVVEEARYRIARHSSMNEFLEYLNSKLGLDVPTNVFEVFDKLNLFESDFASLIVSVVPRPLAVLEASVKMHRGAKTPRYLLEASLDEHHVRDLGLGLGTRCTIAVFI